GGAELAVGHPNVCQFQFADLTRGQSECGDDGKPAPHCCDVLGSRRERMTATPPLPVPFLLSRFGAASARGEMSEDRGQRTENRKYKKGWASPWGLAQPFCLSSVFCPLFSLFCPLSSTVRRRGPTEDRARQPRRRAAAAVAAGRPAPAPAGSPATA